MQREMRIKLNQEFYTNEIEKNMEKNQETVIKLAVVYNLLMILFSVVMHFYIQNSKLDLFYLIYIPLQALVSIIVVFALRNSKNHHLHNYICKFYRAFCIGFIILVSCYPFPEKPAIYFPAVMLFCSVILIFPLWENVIATTLYELVFLGFVFLVKWDHPNVVQYDICASIAAYMISLIAMVLINNLRLKEYQSGRVKDDFLARMSHDIRTPINAIVGMTNLAQWEVDDKEKVVDYLHKIENSSQYLLSLVNDILDSVKINNGELKFYEEKYSQEEFVQVMRIMFQPVCDAKDITLVIDTDKCHKTVMIDKMRFNQIVFNLISNAIKFTPVGGTVRYEVLQIQEFGEYERFTFAVSDNGCGMSPEFQKHLFERFSQERTDRNRNVQGSGLGLSIVKNLVECMDGSIQIESSLDQGTRFIVSIMIHLSQESRPEEEAEASVRREVQQEQSLEEKRILVVEDNEINAQITRKILERKGMKTEWAENGLVAVNLYKDSAIGWYDAILMDIRMPVMDGIESARTIRSLHREDVSIPIIALTANAFEEDIRQTKEAGMDCHLEKPVQPDRLYQVLQQILNKDFNRR